MPNFSRRCIILNKYYSVNSIVDRIKSIKRTNSNKRHDYYSLWNKYKDRDKCMLTFTYNDDNKYFKLQVVNEIKNYFSKLLRNSPNDDVKYYSNIELGEDFNNPHLHIQCFYSDFDNLLKIRDKVIAKFGLLSEFCLVSTPATNSVFSYVIKDYSKDLTTKQLIDLDNAKKAYREYLGKNIRFSSHSRDSYSKSIYKRAYSKGILRENVNYLLDNLVINNEIEIIDNRVILMLVISLLVPYRTRVETRCFVCGFESVDLIFFFEFWIFGFL